MSRLRGEAVIGAVLTLTALGFGAYHEASFLSANARMESWREQLAASDRARPEEGALALVSGIPVITEKAVDPVFDKTFDTLDFRRSSRIVQWRERCGGETDGSRYCNYALEWSDQEIPSEHFAHPDDHWNAGVRPYPSIERQASFTLDGLAVDPAFAALMGDRQPISLTQEDYAGVPQALADTMTVSKGVLLPKHPIGMGDVSFSFSGRPVAPYTLVGRFVDGVVVPITDDPQAWVLPGVHDADAMVDHADGLSRLDYIGDLSIEACVLLCGLFALLLAWAGRDRNSGSSSTGRVARI